MPLLSYVDQHLTLISKQVSELEVTNMADGYNQQVAQLSLGQSDYEATGLCLKMASAISCIQSRFNRNIEYYAFIMQNR